MDKITFSFVIPIFNEEAVFPRLEEAMTALLGQPELKGCSEVIMVDDGSSDGSWAMIADLSTRDPRFTGIRLSRNFGHQFALTAGYSFTRGEANISMDADLQDPPAVALELISKWRQGFDIVYAVRTVRHGEPFLRLLAINIFYRLIFALSDSKPPKNVGDFRLMSRRALDAFLRLPEHHRYIRGLVGWLGFKTSTVEYVRQPRAAGETKYPLRKLVRLAFDGIVSMSSAPLRFSYLAAMAGTVFFLGLLLYTLVEVFFGSSQIVPGWTSLLVTIITFGVLNLISIGLIGEYVGRIYEESKRRPLYLVSDVIQDGSVRTQPDQVLSERLG